MSKLSPITPPKEQLEFWERDIQIPVNRVFFRIDEVAKYLMISNQQVRDLTNNGELEGVPMNSPLDPETKRRHIRITKRSIEEFVNRRRKAL